MAKPECAPPFLVKMLSAENIVLDYHTTLDIIRDNWGYAHISILAVLVQYLYVQWKGRI